MQYCVAVSPEIKGGQYGCGRERGHPGVHMAESGDNADWGFYKGWEIVPSIQNVLDQVARITGVYGVIG